MIFLRNVIIYFDRATQIALFRRIAPYLDDSSYLFLGHSESVLRISDQFVTAGHTIYRPRPGRAAPAEVVPVTRLEAGQVLICREPARIDAVVGPCVSICLFDSSSKVGGMNQFSTLGRARGQPLMQQLVARMTDAGAAHVGLRAKLVGGGAANSNGERDVALAEAFLDRAGIPIVSKRVGGARRREVQFFTHSGRLLCRDED